MKRDKKVSCYLTPFLYRFTTGHTHVQCAVCTVHRYHFSKVTHHLHHSQHTSKTLHSLFKHSSHSPHSLNLFHSLHSLHSLHSPHSPHFQNSPPTPFPTLPTPHIVALSRKLSLAPSSVVQESADLVSMASESGARLKVPKPLPHRLRPDQFSSS